MKEWLVNYWLFGLDNTYPRAYLASLVGAAACIMLFSVVALHAFIPAPQPLADVMLHALSIALTYSLTIGVVLVAISFLRIASFAVWQVWLVSLLIYILGFWLSPLADAVTTDVKYSLHPDLEQGDGLFHFLRLVPVWIVMTILMVGQLQRREFEKELAYLATINAQLNDKSASEALDTSIEFESGQKRLCLDARTINCITVDDHYCAIHVDVDGETHRHDVSQPLGAIARIVPDYFLRVHRSHIVNLMRVKQIKRQARNLSLLVGEGDMVVPVSRGRANEVLQKLESI